MAIIPVKEFRFEAPSSHMHELRCKNHHDMKYLWKGPGRTLHFMGFHRECECPISDLEVLTDEDSKYDENGMSKY